MKDTQPAIWFPTVKTNTGSDKFTEQLVSTLNLRGVRAEITWLPAHAEYLPWFVSSPKKPDWANIVHINSWLHPKFYPKDLPIITTIHHCVQDKAFAPYKTNLQKLYHYLWITPIEKKSIQKANFITAVSQYTAYCAKEIFKISNVEVIYNGIDIDTFNTLSQEKKINHHKFRLLFVGNNSVRKGFDLLPQIMNHLGDDYELYYTADSSNNLPSNMKKLPYQKTAHDLAKIYSSMDALIFPSRLEGFGLVVAEAMACGLPVIITDGSALSELVNHEKTGFLCPQDNTNSFSATILQLANDKELQIKISLAANEHALKYFNINQIIEQYLNLYRRAIN